MFARPGVVPPIELLPVFVDVDAGVIRLRDALRSGRVPMKVAGDRVTAGAGQVDARR